MALTEKDVRYVADLAHLKRLAQLRQLDLRGTTITDAGLEQLKGLSQLQGLLLSGTQITDVGLEQLRGLAQLQGLGLSATRVTDAGVEAFRAAVRTFITAQEIIVDNASYPTPTIETRRRPGSRTSSTDSSPRPPRARHTTWIVRALERLTRARRTNEKANATRL